MIRVPAAALGVLLLLRRLFVVVSVQGGSMRPTYSEGDVLLATRLPALRRGRVLVFRPPYRVTHPDDPRYRVKRLVAVAGDRTPEWVGGVTADVVPRGRLVVRGDHERSEDSRTYGFVDRADVLAVVVGRISRTGGQRADLLRQRDLRGGGRGSPR